MRLSLIVTLMLCLISAVAGATPDFDVVGLKLGMSGADAKALIEQKYPDFQISEFMQGDEVSGYLAKKNSAQTDAILVMFNKDTGVWLAGRGQEYPKDGRSTVAAIRESVEKKYNLKAGKAGNRIVWAYDHNGKLYSEADSKKICQATNMPQPSMMQASPTGLYIQNNFDALCGVSLKLYIGEDLSNREMATAYSVMLIDNKTMYDKLTSEAEAAEKAARDKLEQEKAKAPGADL